MKYRIHHRGFEYYHAPWAVQRREWFLLVPWWRDLKSCTTSEECAEYIDKLKSVDMLNKYI